MQCEIWIVTDGAGDYAVGTDQDGAVAAYKDNIGDNAGPLQAIKLILDNVPQPDIVEVVGRVPDIALTGNVPMIMTLEEVKEAE